MTTRNTTIDTSPNTNIYPYGIVGEMNRPQDSYGIPDSVPISNFLNLRYSQPTERDYYNSDRYKLYQQQEGEKLRLQEEEQAKKDYESRLADFERYKAEQSAEEEAAQKAKDEAQIQEYQSYVGNAIKALQMASSVKPKTNPLDLLTDPTTQEQGQKPPSAEMTEGMETPSAISGTKSNDNTATQTPDTSNTQNTSPDWRITNAEVNTVNKATEATKLSDTISGYKEDLDYLYSLAKNQADAANREAANKGWESYAGIKAAYDETVNKINSTIEKYKNAYGEYEKTAGEAKDWYDVLGMQQKKYYTPDQTLSEPFNYGNPSLDSSSYSGGGEAPPDYNLYGAAPDMSLEGGGEDAGGDYTPSTGNTFNTVANTASNIYGLYRGIDDMSKHGVTVPNAIRTGSSAIGLANTGVKMLGEGSTIGSAVSPYLNAVSPYLSGINIGLGAYTGGDTISKSGNVRQFMSGVNQIVDPIVSSVYAPYAFARSASGLVNNIIPDSPLTNTIQGIFDPAGLISGEYPLSAAEDFWKGIGDLWGGIF